MEGELSGAKARKDESNRRCSKLGELSSDEEIELLNYLKFIRNEKMTVNFWS